MSDDNATSKRKMKWNSSYSAMSMEEAEDKLGFRIPTLERKAISVATMLGNAKHRLEEGDTVEPLY